MQFIDLGAQRERIRDKLKAAIDRVVDDGRYILGPQVAEFENALADYVGVKHVVACANGTDALLLPLMAYGVGPGDAVFCPSFTFAATAEVVALRQAEPVFVEIDPDTYNIDPASLEDAIEMVKAEGRLTPRAIIPVDLFGLSADYSAITAIAETQRERGHEAAGNGKTAGPEIGLAHVRVIPNCKAGSTPPGLFLLTGR